MHDTPNTPPRTGRIRPRAAAVALAFVGALGWTGLVGLGPASAHTELISSDPATGAVLTGEPTSVTLVFNDGVAPQFAAVAVSAGGGELVEVPAVVDGAQVTADASASARRASAPGEATPWQVAYRVVAGDGHPITGTIEFTVTVPQASPTGAATPDPSPAPAPAPAPADAIPAPTPSAAANGVDDAGDDRTGSASQSTGGLLVVVIVAVAAVLLLALATTLVARARKNRDE